MNVRRLLKVAGVICRRRGFPVHEIEYESAIGYGVARALAGPLTGGCSISTRACHLALYECFRTRRWIRRFPGHLPSFDPVTYDPLPIEGDDLISFVAAVGRKSAAAILMISKTRLRARLDKERRCSER